MGKRSLLFISNFEMRQFLKMVLIWATVAFLLASALDAIISSGLRRTDIRKYAVWNDIHHATIDADLVVIGSSRAWCAYNTYLLDSLLHCNSYNLGIDGHSLNMQLIRYETYRRFNPAPKVIVLNTDFISTFNVNADPQYEREQFFPYITDKELIASVKDEKNLSLLERCFPLVRYFGYREDIATGVTSFFGRTVFPDGGMHKGYRGNNYPWREPRTDTLYHVVVDSSQVQLLDSFVSQIQAEGINVFFVESPVYMPLEDCYEGVDKFNSILDCISKSHGVRVFDYTQESFCWNRNYFYDAGHLNSRGSEVFTRMLCEDLTDALTSL